MITQWLKGMLVGGLLVFTVPSTTIALACEDGATLTNTTTCTFMDENYNPVETTVVYSFCGCRSVEEGSSRCDPGDNDPCLGIGNGCYLGGTCPGGGEGECHELCPDGISQDCCRAD